MFLELVEMCGASVRVHLVEASIEIYRDLLGGLGGGRVISDAPRGLLR